MSINKMTDLPNARGISRHRFFKGCTRPAMFMSVPIVPFLLTTGLFLLLIVWSYYLQPYLSLVFVLVYIPLVLTMRQMTKKDDQRLRQMLLRIRTRIAQANRNQWGAISFSPISYKKRK